MVKKYFRWLRNKLLQTMMRLNSTSISEEVNQNRLRFGKDEAELWIKKIEWPVEQVIQYGSCETHRREVGQNISFPTKTVDYRQTDENNPGK